ncbi:MAG: hypothetical protein ACYDEX_17030 [Mobilitalea sp.]
MNKKKGRYMKAVLAGMFIFLIFFTGACLFITYKTKVEPNTLIVSVFAFCGAEGGIAAFIKNTKEKKKKENID